MDVVPVIIEVEERFGVTLPEERGGPVTVGDLYLSLLSQIRWPVHAPCPTSHAFYRLRRVLTGEFEVDRRRIRPATRLCDLFPAAARSATWQRLAAALCLYDLKDLPCRRVPSARIFRMFLGGISVSWWILYPLLVLVTGDDFTLIYGIAIWLLLVLLVCEWFGILCVAGFLDYLERVRVPQVRHLVIRLAVQQADLSASGEATPRRVWEELVNLIAAQTGAPPHQIHPEQCFSELPDYC